MPAPAPTGARLEEICIEVVSTALDQYRPQLLAAALSGDRQERANARHEDNFLSDFDLDLHDHYRAELAARLPGFVYLSEEGEPEIVGADPELAVLVDPLDTSELAVRGLNGYTHLLVWSLAETRPLVAVVGDFYHHIDLYVGNLADRPRTQLRTRGGALQPVQVPDRRPGDRLLVTSYNMRPTERYQPLAAQSGLIDLLAHGPNDHPATADGPTGDHSRIGVDFGSIGFCHVATGATDVFLEFAKGFALWDLLPGRLILEAAGGAITDLTGQPLPWPTQAFATLDTMNDAMDTRQTFITAANHDVAHMVASAVAV